MATKSKSVSSPEPVLRAPESNSHSVSQAAREPKSFADLAYGVVLTNWSFLNRGDDSENSSENDCSSIRSID